MAVKLFLVLCIEFLNYIGFVPQTRLFLHLRNSIMVLLALKLFSMFFILIRSLMNHSKAYNNSRTRRYSDIKELKKYVGKILYELQNGSTINRLEQTFKFEKPPDFDICSKNYYDLCKCLEKLWGKERITHFGKKLFDVTTNCKNAKTFRAQFTVFWIKVEGLLNDGCFIELKDVPATEEPNNWIGRIGNSVLRCVLYHRKNREVLTG